MSDSQCIACDFTAIEEDEREDHKDSANQLFKSIERWEELENGYAFRIPTDTQTIEKAGAFMARERLCCPFFNFSLNVTADHGPVWLHITGTDKVKSYIAESIIPQLDNIDSDGLNLPENAKTSK